LKTRVFTIIKIIGLGSAFTVCIVDFSTSGISGTVTDVRIILQYAIKANACGLIICYNHPSGTLQPSESDLTNSRKVKYYAILMYSAFGSVDNRT